MKGLHHGVRYGAGMLLLLVGMAGLLACAGGAADTGTAPAVPTAAASPVLDGTPTAPAYPTPGVATPTPSPATDQPAASIVPTGRLVFQSGRSGSMDIYLIDADGSDLTQLTGTAEDAAGATAIDREPAWSPDGTRLVFSSDRSGNDEVYVMQADGSGLVNLSNHPAADHRPRWSPDGTRIAFTSYRDTDTGEMYVMQADGSNVVRVTSNDVAEYSVSWSPDSTRLLFWTEQEGDGEIFVVNADGSGLLLLEHGTDPAWSPDGTRVAFTALRDDVSSLYVVNADGSNPVRLLNEERDPTNARSVEYVPDWSPDGTRIAFSRTVRVAAQTLQLTYGVYQVNVDGSGLFQLAETASGVAYPRWSPDGAFLAFVDFPQTDGDVEGTMVLVSADGVLLQALTRGWWHAWQPQVSAGR